MKNFILTLSVFLMANLVVNGQEIIKTKAIEQIKVKSPTLRYPEAKSEVSKKDSSVLITMYCGESKLNSTQIPLYIIKIGEKQYKLKDSSILSNKKQSNLPQLIQSIEILKDEEATNTFGEEGKNGVIYITLNENKYSYDYGKTIKKFILKNPPKLIK